MLDKLSNLIELASSEGIRSKFTLPVIDEIVKLGFSKPVFKRYCAVVDMKLPQSRPLNAINRLESFLKSIDPRLRACHIGGTAGTKTYSKVVICLAGDEKKATKAALDLAFGG